MLANATVAYGLPGVDGCQACDCCHDFISDCDECVNTKCLAPPSSGEHYQCTAWREQGKVDNQRHPPVPKCYRYAKPQGSDAHFPKGSFNNSAW